MLFLSFLHSLLNLWPIFTFYTAIESYRHVDYTCFIHFEKSQKMKAPGQKKCSFFLFFSDFKAVFFQLFIFFHSSLIFWPIFTFFMAMESYGHVDYTCFIHFEKSQKMKALGQKKCYKNSEPPNLELYPLIHFILPSIQKLSNFQVSYHFGKLLSSWFQNFCPFCINELIIK